MKVETEITDRRAAYRLPARCPGASPGIAGLFAALLAIPLAVGSAVAYEPASTAATPAPSLAVQTDDTLPEDPADSTVVPPPHRDRNPLRASVGAVRILVEDGFYVYTMPVRWQSGDWFSLGGALAITGLVFAYDQEILAAVDRNKEEFPLRQMLEVGRALDPVGFGRFNTFTFGAMTLAWVTGQDKMALIFGQIIEAHLIAGVGKTLAVHVIGRPRPFESEDPYVFGRSDATSFPSGHSINIFEIATIFSHHIDRSWFTWTAYFGAVCVGLQRVESKAHWPSDVVLSAIFGTAVARTIVRRQDERSLVMSPHVGAEGVGWKFAWSF